MKRKISKMSAGLLILAAAAPVLAQATPGREVRTQPASPLAPQAQVSAAPQFEKIYTIGADGKPMAPDTWLDVAALAVNPTIPADQRERIEAAVQSWLADVQRLVIENPDLALEAAKGLFETVELEERAGLAYASEVMKALGSTTNLSSYLTTEGVLTNEQGETNRLIVQDYVRARSEAISKDIMAEAPEDQQRQMQLLMARTTMTSLTDDARRMFRSVAVRGAPHAAEAVKAAGLDASAYSAELEAVRQAGGDQAKVEAMVALMDAMETMDLFEFTRALGPMLPPIEVPQLATVGSAKAASDNG
jgi:hypothetical protein